jgi:hypothetical protein
MAPTGDGPGRLVKIDNNVCQMSGGRECNLSNVFTTFGGYFFQNIEDGDFAWSTITSGPKMYFTAGTGTSATGAADPAAAADYKMAAATAYFEQGGGSPRPLRTMDSYEEDATLSELVLTYKMAQAVAETDTYSEIGIYMYNTYGTWNPVETDRSTYVLTGPTAVYNSPQMPTLIARVIVPAENRITKATGNDITWRWTFRFTG